MKGSKIEEGALLLLFLRREANEVLDLKVDDFSRSESDGLNPMSKLAKLLITSKSLTGIDVVLFRG